MKNCTSCGMPMEKLDDFAAKDISKDYCVYCADAEGTLKSYEVALEDATRFLMKENNVDYETAKKESIEYMATMPAWKKINKS